MCLTPPEAVIPPDEGKDPGPEHEVVAEGEGDGRREQQRPLQRVRVRRGRAARALDSRGRRHRRHVKCAWNERWSVGGRGWRPEAAATCDADGDEAECRQVERGEGPGGGAGGHRQDARPPPPAAALLPR